MVQTCWSHKATFFILIIIIFLSPRLQTVYNLLQTSAQWSLGIQDETFFSFIAIVEFDPDFINPLYGLPLFLQGLFILQFRSNLRQTLAQWSLGIQVPIAFFSDPASGSRIVQDLVNPLCVIMLVEWFTCRLINSIGESVNTKRLCYVDAAVWWWLVPGFPTVLTL